MTSNIVAPALSTSQTDSLFSKISSNGNNKPRPYLNVPNDKQTYGHHELLNLLSDYYSIGDLITYLESHPEYIKITLQFPDNLVMDSSHVIELLQSHFGNPLNKDPDCSATNDIGCCKKDINDDKNNCFCHKNVKKESMAIANNKRKFWVLADTAYSSCCVDEVAAEHVKADLVIHFGDSCLNAIQKLPVIYSFGTPKIDVDEIVNKIVCKMNDTGNGNQNDKKICLMADAPHTYCLNKIAGELIKLGFANVIYCDINFALLPENCKVVGSYYNKNNNGFSEAKDSKNEGEPLIIGENRVVFAQNQEGCSSIEELGDFNLFHITTPEPPQLLYLTTIFNNGEINIINTNDGVCTIDNGPFPSMMKRYRYMHMARTAGTIGILVNTLSLRKTKETINVLTRMIKEHEKKSYLFVVGKPNVAKLANFEAIDVWCILGCPQGGIIVDTTNEFYKPIITPYELQLSLRREISWTGKWITPFENVLREIKENNPEYNIDDNTDNDEPVFSAVTGQYVSTSRPLRHIEHLEIEYPKTDEKSNNNTLVKQFSSQLTIRNTVSTSAAVLQNRQWTGLGSDFVNSEDKEEDGATVEQGISGVARGYQFDRDIAGI
ncbi:2-(3-amino-3-carboxypropyl)histidine synthase SCDLUD_004301 [Saccharomycodes ludwigii]|uniref:2-(3-amino-3-carboxypropyl)histidine synthase n=1 Tax=Saccharomycodes ludwigii TaxID=36035 RepID=UPI001E88F85F|nr:hypothetical protein SCDLUD_004301 [Saccharomycodes ludwigii]KAH3899984.1 hypothetical protein SCDLUD_004301 [Saccharomycodes ludwigii]